MSQSISADAAFARRMQNRGITEDVGVFGDHRVRLGKGSPIRLDRIQSAAVPWAGFTQASKVRSGFAGASATAEDAVRTLIRPGGLDAKSLLGALKAQRTHLDRLDDLGRLSQGQKDDTAWLFAPAVERLSNVDLAALCQRFTSAETDLLMAALQREASLDPATDDAWNAARALFDLQALALKETSARAVRGMAADEIAAHPVRKDALEPLLPGRLSADYAAPAGAVPLQAIPGHGHDITAANLRTLVETASVSAIRRENTAEAETGRLKRRSLDSVSLKEMGDVLRSAELTINIPTDILLLERDSVTANPDDPLYNIFHLESRGIAHGKGAGYVDRRDETERLLFPELEGHKVNPDERPVYGALNLMRRPIGALRNSKGYGTSAIVLKPEVARRATYTADDTFFAPIVSLSPERRQAFYALLDDAKLPRPLVEALRDGNSPQRAALEQWFDALAAIDSPRANALGTPPPAVHALLADGTVDCLDSFTALLIRCFGDKAATRGATASWDNLESLIPQLGDIDGNMLANAAMRSRDGSTPPRAYLQGSQYVEAQIHGPIVPRRDIQEIRIDLDDVPPADRPALKARMKAFAEESGIPVKFVSLDEEEETNRLAEIQEEDREFNGTHMDEAVLEEAQSDILSHLDERLRKMIADRHDLQKGLPAALNGTFTLDGAARRALERALVEEVELARREKPNEPKALVEAAFDSAADRILREKAGLLRELEKLDFESDAQKLGFASWICGAGDLRSAEEVRFFHARAKAQAALFRDMLALVPPPTPTEIARRMAGVISATGEALTASTELRDRKSRDPDFGPTVMNRIAFLSIGMLRNGEPPLDADGLNALNALLNGPEQRNMIAMLQCALAAAMKENDSAEDDSPALDALATQMAFNAEHVCRAATNAPWTQPDFLGGPSLIPESVRAVIRSVAPRSANVIDTAHPAHPSFPAPAMPDRLPRDDTGRRRFLVGVLDAYVNHEKTFELGTSYHGRGHIARAWIFATTMCGILEEQGLHVDRNAVLCGIAGHDMGRRGGGQDHWEGRSAQMTVEAMRTAFGDDSMGRDYEQQVGDSIDAHKGRTLEALLLNAADSLDIGRIGPGYFAMEKFAFLRADPGMRETTAVRKLREDLAKEADLLQQLTNPMCQWKGFLDELDRDIVAAAEANDEAAAEILSRQKDALLKHIADEFAKEWELTSEQFMARVEDVIRTHRDLFPTLSRHYPLAPAPNPEAPAEGA